MHTAAPFDTSSLARIPVRGSAPSGEGREPDGRTEADCRPMVSVVLPAYNEAGIIEKNIEVLCRYLRGVEPAYRWELVIVNDGSSDDTGELAEKCAAGQANITVLHHPCNFRLGQALRSAFSACRGDYIVVLDLDLSYSPDHIERMLRKIIESKAKIVIASPYMKGGQVSNVPWHRRWLSILANRYLCMTLKNDRFSDKITTVTGMVRAYDREFLSRLKLKAMDVDINSEILYKAKILRARIVEIPAHLNWGSQKGVKKSKGSARKSSLRILHSIVQSLVSGFIFRPFLFFVLPGVFCLLLSAVPIMWAFIHSLAYYQKGPANAGADFDFSTAIGLAFQQSPHAFIVGGVSLIVGIQLVNWGMLAFQNKRYFEELFDISSALYSLENKARSGTESHRPE